MRGRVPTLFFYMWIYPVVSAPYVDCSFPLNCLDTLVENILTINVRTYFWTLSSLQVICKSVLQPLTHILDYCRFTVSFEIGNVNIHTSFFFNTVLDV